MVERSELQKMARTIDAHRKQLDNLHSRVEQVTAILEEHGITANILQSLQKSATTGRTGARLSIGSGVTLNYIHAGEEEGTALVDLGSGVYGERKPEDAEELVAKRLKDLTELKSQFEADAALMTKRIEELAKSFELAAQEMTESKEPVPERQEPTPEKTTRRRRGMGSELTLDD